jgi:hypothetical protein
MIIGSHADAKLDQVIYNSAGSDVDACIWWGSGVKCEEISIDIAWVKPLITNPLDHLLCMSMVEVW